MYPIDLTGKKGVVFGVANDRSIAWAIAKMLGDAGAQLALVYQNDRLKDRVVRLADTLDNAITLPCDASDDEQMNRVQQSIKLRRFVLCALEQRSEPTARARGLRQLEVPPSRNATTSRVTLAALNCHEGTV